jgi:hypothetical protein
MFEHCTITCLDVIESMHSQSCRPHVEPVVTANLGVNFVLLHTSTTSAKEQREAQTGP